MTVYEFIKEHGRVLIEATWSADNLRHLYLPAEHLNLGEGWLLRDMCTDPGAVVRDAELADPKLVIIDRLANIPQPLWSLEQYRPIAQWSPDGNGRWI